MKQIIISDAYKVEIRDTEIPEINDDQFLLKARMTGVSAGTELMWYNGSNPGLKSGRCKYPFLPGYEFIGEVVETGKNVSEVKKGDRVYTWASHQEYAAVDRKSIYSIIPPDVKDREAVCMALTATSVNSIHTSKIMLGDTVAVVGLGVLGILIGQSARAAGASKVIGVDIQDFKMPFAEKAGFDHTVNPTKENLEDAVKSETGGHGADIAIEAAGNSAAVGSAVDCARLNGRVVVAGFQTKPFSINGEKFWTKDLEIAVVQAIGPGSDDFNYVRWNRITNFHEAARLIYSRLVRGEFMISHEFKPEDFRRIYNILDKKDEDFMHMVLNWLD